MRGRREDLRCRQDPDDASCDVLARRIAAGAAGVGAASLSVYDAFVGEGAVGIAG